MGACGAGTEDVLRLVEVSDRPVKLVERDSLLVQSCLRSLALIDDTGTTLRSRLSRSDPTHLTLTWLDHPRFGSDARVVSVRNGKLELK
jgi:hypothetical protein